ncbi:MAG: hypothetical protein ACI4GW_04325 [Lachnospiraceae bacterium]
MQANVFNENVDYLYQVQTDLEAVEQLKNELAEYRNQEKNLKKAIASEDKSIQNEIAQTIQKRKNEIEKVYDNQIDANKSKSRSVRAKRDRAKSKRMDERVSYETADLSEENRQLQVEMKTLFKAQHVPSFCRNGLFYVMFMPKGILEILGNLVSVILLFLALPSLMYILSVRVFYTNQPEITLLCTITVALTLFVVGLLYVLVLNFVKLACYETLLEGRHIKDQIAANKKQMKAIRNKISKDKDDSQYGLDAYDNRLKELEEELEQISLEKQEAMTDFENETKQVLTNEVNDRRLGKLEDMKMDLEDVEQQITLVEGDINSSSTAITNNYGMVLGEFCTLSKVADLISLMEDGTADTVSEAIEAYRGAGK